MGMVETITLSAPAVDLLGEQLNLTVRRYPYELPRIADFPEGPEQVARQVWQELESGGLARNGRPEPEVEDALYLLCSSEVSIAAAGLLDVRNGHRLSARVVATGEVGVLGVHDGRALRMTFLSPSALPRAATDLLPDAPVGGAAPVTAVADRRSGPPADSGISGLGELRAVVSRPKLRYGHYVITGPRGTRVPNLIWFDTDQGRYALRGDRTEAQDALTCQPADKPTIAAELGALLEQARG
ncbi:ESX secretion-associated protein EspG [Saccharopolyspora griseoalba]